MVGKAHDFVDLFCWFCYSKALTDAVAILNFEFCKDTEWLF